jgi:hypothetical protein
MTLVTITQKKEPFDVKLAVSIKYTSAWNLFFLDLFLDRGERRREKLITRQNPVDFSVERTSVSSAIAEPLPQSTQASAFFDVCVWSALILRSRHTLFNH